MRALIPALALAFVCSVSITRPARAVLADADFLAQTGAAMSKMMSAMEIAPSGNADQDFVGSMVPHHRGAIDMAAAELRYGHNVALQRIAQEIVVTQQDEIVAMRRALAIRPSAAPPVKATPNE